MVALSLEFESSVNSRDSETLRTNNKPFSGFESSVNSRDSETGQDSYVRCNGLRVV